MCPLSGWIYMKSNSQMIAVLLCISKHSDVSRMYDIKCTSNNALQLWLRCCPLTCFDTFIINEKIGSWFVEHGFKFMILVTPHC